MFSCQENLLIYGLARLAKILCTACVCAGVRACVHMLSEFKCNCLCFYMHAVLPPLSCISSLSEINKLHLL